MTTGRKYTIAALIAALVALSACSAPNTAPTTPPNTVVVPPVVVTVSLSGLSGEAQSVIKASVSALQIRRWADRTAENPIRVYSPFGVDASQWGINAVSEDTGYPLKLVPENQAELKILQEASVLGDNFCGDGSPLGDPVITGGVLRVAYGVKAECTADLPNLQSMIAHELGHVFGYGHSPAKRDYMSSPGAMLARHASLAEAGHFIRNAPIGAVVK